MLGQIDAIANIATRDIKAAQHFYKNILELTLAATEGDDVLAFTTGRTQIFVYQSDYAGTNQATALSWEVHDVAGTVADLKARGVTFEHYDDMPPLVRDGDIHRYEDNAMAWFKDPDGNILHVFGK